MAKQNPYETPVSLAIQDGEKSSWDDQVFADPCEAASYINKQYQAGRISFEQYQGIISGYLDRCTAYKESTGGVIKITEPPPDTSKSSSVPDPDKLPAGSEDSPERQGAPVLEVEGKVQVLRPPPARADFLQPADAIYDQNYPRNIEEITA